MVNAKRIFFIIVRKVYEAFDFAAPRFIQLVIRKPHLERVFDYRKARPPGVPPLKLKNSPAFQRWVKRFARGRRDNSPAFQRWDNRFKIRRCPTRTTEPVTRVSIPPTRSHAS